MSEKPSVSAPFVYAVLALLCSYLFLISAVTSLNPLLAPAQLATFTGHISQVTTGLATRSGTYWPTLTLCEGTQCLQVKTKQGLSRVDVAALDRETARVTVAYQPGYLQVGFPLKYNCAWGVATAEHVYVDGDKLYAHEKAVHDTRAALWVSLLFGLPAVLLWFGAFRSYRVLYGKLPKAAR